MTHYTNTNNPIDFPKSKSMMNERIRLLAEQAGMLFDERNRPLWVAMDQVDKAAFLKEFSNLIVYDFLDELTNDDSLGEARIATIRRLAEKWGVAR